MMIGALLLLRFLPRRRTMSAAVIAWVVAGVSSVATGLVPVDADLTLHSLVALPSLIAMPVGLLLLGIGFRGANTRLALVTVAAGVVSALGAVAFLATAGSPEWGGVWERVGFWPAYVVLPIVAVRVLRGRRPLG